MADPPYPWATLSVRARVDLVRAVLGDEHADMCSSEVEELYGFGPGSHICRVSGTAKSLGHESAWSFVLKGLAPGGVGVAAASADVTAWDYWKREWLAYQAPWLRDLRGPVVGPRCLGGAGEDAGVGAWVALEDLTPYNRRPWSLEEFRTAARQLGEFQAPYLMGRPLPTEPWLCPGRARGWTEHAAAMVALLPTVQDHPLVRRIVPAHLVGVLEHLWRERESVFDQLAALPQTLCHGNFYPRNLFLRPRSHENEIVAVDWASCGRGPVGDDLACLVGSSLVWFEAEPSDADELEALCLQGYLEGLHLAGWDGNDDDVRLGYLATDVLTSALGGLGPTLTTMLDESLHPVIEQVFGRPIEALIENFAAIWTRQEPQIERLKRLLAARSDALS